MTTSEQRATSLLQHYLHMAVTASGQRWDGDNNAEVADIVDSIIDAATATPAQPAEPAQPDALTRIAVALERIANRLDMLSAGGTDYNGDEMSVLRVGPLN